MHFKKNVSLTLKNRIRISGFFPPVFLLRNTEFLQTGKSTKNCFFRLKTLSALTAVLTF
jgi:hypothetical protein